MNYIEEVLYEKTKDFYEGQIYSDQWKFAKSYLPKLLETISHIFPHYSLHNSIHSEAILNNIVKIVGTNSIKQLSVVDLWLLLAAAYYHDSGMVVTGNDKKDLFKDGSDFVKFVAAKQHDLSSPLKPYAILFEVKDNKVYYKNEQLTHDSYEGARFLLAEYVRSKHAERSGKRIETDGSLHFPGDPIPERIIRLLKSICSCHTKDVSEVMKLQPIESSGCGIEDCHPRFVAAMLRLGDLLDVDSNRVSEVLLSTLGSIPSDSKYYNKTNRAITHLRIDSSVIEITADCNDYHVADLINRWFQCLNDELVFYMKQWHRIIPFEGFGYLPTVGDLKVNLSDYDTFDGKKRPSFEIDSSKAIELLQGAGLYTDSCECIREILQNATDAIYLRVYKENPGINSIKQFKEQCEKYPISVKLDKIVKADSKNDASVWRIEISDKGIGMTKDDLRFLSKTGSSGRNMEKKMMIQSVPDFLRPSGAFGIGFQSVFLITDRVNIISRKVNKDHYVRAQLYNPAGQEKGAILIQSISKEDVDYGTSISFDFIDERRHQLLNYEDRYAVYAYNSFDFAKNKHINLMGMKVMDEVVRFANGTFIPVDFFLNGEKKKYVSSKTKIDFGDIDNETGMQVYIDKANMVFGDAPESKVYFRNQWVRDYYPNLPLLSFHINVLKGNAKEVLTLNRNQIRREYEAVLNVDIKKSVVRYLNKKIESLDSINRQLASMFLYLYKDFAIEKGITGIRERDYWKAYELKAKAEGSDEIVPVTIDKLLLASSIEYIERSVEDDLLVFDLSGQKFYISLDYGTTTYWAFRLIVKIAQNYGFHLSLRKKGFLLIKNDCAIIENSDDVREQIMLGYLRKDGSARSFFPCSDNYKVLQVHNELLARNNPYGLSIEYPRMICPYVRKYDIEHFDEAIKLEYDVDSKVINTVFDNRIDKSVTKEQIKEAYKTFKSEWDTIVERVNNLVKKEPRDFIRTLGYRIIV